MIIQIKVRAQKQNLIIIVTIVKQVIHVIRKIKIMLVCIFLFVCMHKYVSLLYAQVCYEKVLPHRLQKRPHE